MCRSIVQLRRPEGAVAEDITAAARQYVRKVSGFREPSKANREVFDRAVEEIAAATDRLLGDLVVRSTGGRG